MRKIFFDENSQKEIIEKGYTKVQLLEDKEIAHIMKEIKELRPDDRFDPKPDEYGFTFHFTFIDTNIEYRRKTHDLLQSVFSPHIKRLLINYDFITCNFYLKSPGKGQLHVHQNWNMTANQKETSVTIWCPLIDVDEHNGTLQVVEGSHKLVPNIESYMCKPFFYNYCESLMKEYSKPIPLKAGEAIIFDDTLIHWSSNNNSSEPRFVASAICVPVEAIPVFYYPDQSNEVNRFELVELNKEFFIENSFQDLNSRPRNLKSLGFIENKNIDVSEDEFLVLLNQNLKETKEIQPVEKLTKSIGNHSFLNRIKSFFLGQ